MREPEYFDPADPQTKLRDIVLSFFYQQIRQGKTNQEIFHKMHSTDMPPVTEAQLNALRHEFRVKEQKYPEKMAKFRQMLKVP